MSEIKSNRAKLLNGWKPKLETLLKWLKELSDLKEKLRVAEEEKQRWANCCGEMIMTCHTCKELDQLKAENERLSYFNEVDSDIEFGVE